MTNPLGDLISRGEGGYNSYNRGTQNGRIVPANQNIDFSQMTMEELQRRQQLPPGHEDRVFAVGKYQIIPSTMQDVVRGLNVVPDERYTPETQERMFADYLIRNKRPAIHAYITGKPGATLHAAQKATCQEWASVDDPDTPGRPFANYAEHGNRSSIRAGQVAGALDQMRNDYREQIAYGQTPSQAWRAVTSAGLTDTRSTERSILQPIPSPSPSDGMLEHGERGPEVRNLQASLKQLGFRDHSGREIVIDGDFGDRTEQALKDFQRAQGLANVDGIVGPKTLEALRKAEQAPLLSNPAHPDNAMYQQALRGVQQLPANSFSNDTERSNAAATLVFEAKVSGVRQIDHVVLSTNGSGLFAVQGRLDDPAHSRIYVDREQAVTQPVERSTEQLRQETARLEQMQAQSQGQVQQQYVEHRGVGLGIRP